MLPEPVYYNDGHTNHYAPRRDVRRCCDWYCNPETGELYSRDQIVSWETMEVRADPIGVR